MGSLLLHFCSMRRGQLFGQLHLYNKQSIKEKKQQNKKTKQEKTNRSQPEQTNQTLLVQGI